jgi:glycosyltransferase involved in cell wall biosynthesis
MKNISNIAVFITTLNRPSKLKLTLKNISEQFCKPKEVFIIDNDEKGSNRNVVEEHNALFSTDYQYIKYNEGLGSYDSKNYAIKKTNCKYLAFHDDDDLWLNNYLKRFAQIQQSKKADIYITEYVVVNENLEKIFDFDIPEEFKLNDIYIWNPGILSSNIIIKKKIFDLIGGYDPKVSGSADKDLLIKIINNNYKYFVIKEKLVLYVTHADQWSKNYAMIYDQSKLFFKKYKNQMNIITMARFYKKLLILFFKKHLKIRYF